MKATRINGTWTYYINGERMTRQELEGLIMTPEQVSALSDTELNRAMIWLYYLGSGINYNPHIGEYYDCFMIVNYMNNYNLTIPLMASKNMELDFIQHDGISSCNAASFDCGFIVNNTNPLRAACECLVLIALADK